MPRTALYRTRAAVCACVLILSGPGAQADDDVLTAAGRKLEAGQVSAAVIDIKNRLQQRPGDGAARRLLGIAYVRLGDGANAEQELTRAAQLGVPAGDLAVPLAEALAVQQQWQALLDRAIVQPNMRTPELAELRALRATAHQALGQTGQARLQFEAAVATDAASARAQLGLAQFDLQAGRWPAARTRLQTLLARQPAPAAHIARLAWTLLGDGELADAQYTAALQAYDAALPLADAASVPQLRLRRGLVRVQLGDDAGARADFEAVAGRLPDQPLMHYGLGLLALRRQQPAEAVTAFERALQRAPEDAGTHEQLARARLALGQREPALADLSGFAARHPEADGVARLLGRLRLSAGDGPGAEAAIQPLLARHPDDAEALEILGMAALLQGRYQEGEAQLRRLVELRPESADAQMRHGLAQLALGEHDAALQSLGAAAGRAPGAQEQARALLLARLASGRHAEALTQAQALSAAHPEAVEPLLYAGAAHEGLQDLPAARADYERALALVPGQAQAAAALARLELLDGRPDSARARYQAVLARSPRHVPTLMALARLEWLHGRPEAAIAALETVAGIAPEAVAPQLLLARLQAQHGRLADAVTRLDNLHFAHPDDEAVLAHLAAARLQAGDIAETERLHRDWLARRPDSVAALYGLAAGAAARGDAEALRQALIPALRADREAAPAPALLTRLDALAADPARARAWLAQLQQAVPDHPALLDHAGDRLGREQGAAKAAAYYALLRGRQPDEARWPQREAAWREAAGEGAAAARMLETWLARHPQAVGLRLQLATLYERLDRLEDARAAFVLVLSQRPDEVVALNDLAWLLRDRDPQQALVHARRAALLAPRPEVLETLGEVLIAAGQPEAAIGVLDTASRGEPSASSIRLNLARAQLASGRVEAARTTLRALLAGAQSFEGRDAALALLGRAGG